jgi:AcrR family transcriptional regulator
MLRPGERLLVFGAAGGVGTAAIQVGKILGAEVIAVASTDEKRTFATEVGADAALDTAAEGWRDRLKATCVGKGPDVIFDPVCGPLFEGAFRSLAWRGRHLVVGFAGGPIPALPSNLTLMKGAALVGVDVRQFQLFEPAAAASHMNELMSWVSSGQLVPPVGRRYSFFRFPGRARVRALRSRDGEDSGGVRLSADLSVASLASRRPAPRESGDMAQKARRSLKRAESAAEPSTVSRKGDEARRRLLSVALEEFGERGFKGATTRVISQRAGLTLPAVKYYFGDKQGLYLACAEEVARHYLRATSSVASAAVTALEGSMTPSDARQRLKEIARALARFLVGPSDERQGVAFVKREMREPGPASDVLYRRLWGPGIELMAALIARAQGRTRVEATQRIEAMMLISSLMPFRGGQRVAPRALGADRLSRAHFEIVCRSLDARIDLFGNEEQSSRKIHARVTSTFG